MKSAQWDIIKFVLIVLLLLGFTVGSKGSTNTSEPKKEALTPSNTGKTSTAKTTKHSYQLFCQGHDPKTKQDKKILFLNQGTPTSTIQVHTRKPGKNKWTLEQEDKKGVLDLRPPEAFPRRMSLSIDQKNKLQIYRNCEPKPICRFEEIQLISPEKVAQERTQINQAFNQAFQMRRQTAMIAQQYSQLRNLALAARMELMAARMKDALKKGRPTTPQALGIQGLNPDHQKLIQEFVQSGHAVEKIGKIKLKELKAARRVALKAYKAYKDKFPKGTGAPKNYDQLSLAQAESSNKEASQKANSIAEHLNKMSMQASYHGKRVNQLRDISSVNSIKPRVRDLKPMKSQLWCNTNSIK